jgi:hypothetical protein
VVGLLVVSPIAAEYLSGSQVFNPLVLLGYLGIFIPLYGTVAVLIREVTRRTGRGWPTILLLGAAFGFIQAGLIDQSLFNPLAVIGLLYLLGAVVVFAYDARPRGFLIAPTQLIGTVVVVAALVAAAVALPRRAAGGRGRHERGCAGPAGWAAAGLVRAVGLGARARAAGRRRSPGGYDGRLLLRR